jgi:hypothetical protein
LLYAANICAVSRYTSHKAVVQNSSQSLTRRISITGVV